MKNQKNTIAPPIIRNEMHGGMVPEGTKTVITHKPLSTRWWRRYGVMALMLMIGIMGIGKVDGQTITSINGTGAYGYTGDGGPAASAADYDQTKITFDAACNLYFTDPIGNRIRKLMLLQVIFLQ